MSRTLLYYVHYVKCCTGVLNVSRIKSANAFISFELYFTDVPLEIKGSAESYTN